MRNYKNAEQRKAEIMEAAINLFSKQGFKKTTMEQVASSVKFARTSLYEYYKSKEDILYSLINEVVEKKIELPQNTSVKKQLEYLASHSIIRLQSNFTLYKILFQELPSLSNPTSDRIQTWQNHTMILVHQVIEQGIKKGAFNKDKKEEDIAFLYKALVGQRLADLLMLDKQVQPDVEAERLINLMWSGIGYIE